MAWRIEFADAALKQLRKLDRPIAARLLEFLERRVATADDPRSLGETLNGPELGRYWKYRIGDYRIVAHVQDRAVTILVVRIGHRREVYR